MELYSKMAALLCFKAGLLSGLSGGRGWHLVHGNRTESGRVDKKRLEVANNTCLATIRIYANNRQAVDDGGVQSG